jgi:hypothetical protein
MTRPCQAARIVCYLPEGLLVRDRRGASPAGRWSCRVAGRAQAALTALAFVLSTLVGLVHEATTRHVQCAEHGEQIHSDAAPLAEAAPVADPAQSGVRGQPAAAIHGHEHCLIASATRASRIAPCAPAIAAANVEPAVRPAIVPRVAAARDHRLYRTAPKTSPPA